MDEPRYELKDCPTCHRVRYMRWARTKGVWRCYGCRGGFAPTAFTGACDYGDLPGDNPGPDPYSIDALLRQMIGYVV